MEYKLLLTATITVAALMSLGWFYQYKKRDAGIVDVFWAFSIGILGVLYASFGETILSRKLILAIMASSWSLRLGVYLLFDRVIGRSEDGRYQYLRNHWGARADFNFFWFFQSQGVAALFFSLPFYFISVNSSSNLTTLEIAGVCLWAIAFAGEWIADLQLRSFRSNPENKGKTCRSGLWKFSRHPNYFFEWLHWCSYPLMLMGAEGLYVSLSCPLVMLYSLFKVTGIPYTEAQALRSRGDDYKKYQSETSAFVPWFPRQAT